MKSVSKKISLLLLIATFATIFAKNMVFASSLDIAKGIMPDSPFYQFRLDIEKINLSFNHDDQKKAQMYLEYSGDRLSDLNYLAGKEDIKIDHVVTVSDEYQKNINQFTKIISENQPNTEKIEQIPPKIEELQQIQNQIVEKINQKEANEEAKIIVKSSIKESQDNLIKAVVSAKKPIEKEVQSQTSENIDKNKEEIVKKLDETIQNLSDKKQELKKEIVQDENDLKQKKENSSNNISTDTVAIIEDKNTKEGNVVDSLSVKEEPMIDNVADNHDNIYIEKTDADIQIDSSTKTDSTNEKTMVADSSLAPLDNSINELDASDPKQNSQIVEWYYSQTCDYVSDKPGSDPICGEEMIPVSSLPADNSFFKKYTIKDGKYVQNIDDLVDKNTDSITSDTSNTGTEPEKQLTNSDPIIQN